MVSNIYSVFDKISKEFAPPFVAKNDASAKRSVHAMLNREGVDATDFTVFCLGHFNSDDGVIGAIEPIDINLSLGYKDEPLDV